MTTPDDLYRELQPELNKLAAPLFDFARGQVEKRGAFLPLGAIITSGGEVILQAALGDRDICTSAEVLPLLHDTLLASVARQPTDAIAVCEWVKVTQQGQAPTDAVKILVEHARGFCVAFYLPCRKLLLRGWQFGEVFAVAAEPEVRPWSPRHAT